MRYTSNKPLVVSSVALLLFVATLAIGTFRTAYADSTSSKSGERLLVIHDGDTEQGILTKSTTVREALEEVDIPFDDNDLVEPGLDEELVATSYDINIYRARPITIVDGAIRKKVMSAYRTPTQIVEHAGMKLQDEDTTEMSLPAGSTPQLTISRATEFTLVLFGKKTTAYTQEKTVAGMMKEKNISLGKDDTLSVSAEAPLVRGMVVELWREGKQTVTEEKEVAFDTERIQDVDRPVGYHEVKTPGTPGKRMVTYEVEMKNGLEVGRIEISSVVTLESKTQVEIIGAKMTNTFDGSFAEALARLRGCESGGRYDRNSGNGYYGAYQYDIQTWANWGGFARADLAPAPVQDEKVWETYKRRGWQPWPSCSRSQGLQDIYR